MKEIILDIVKGMLIGVANVIPGVSGGTLAVSTGIYEKIIYAINSFRKEFKQSVKTLWPIVLGIIIGIVGLAFVITFMLEKFTVPTTALFIGLCLGGVPILYKKVKNEKLKWTHMVAFILTLTLIIVPTIVAINTPAVENIELDIISILILFSLGIISATAMVVPGVSGSMILMMMGYYNVVINTIKETVSSLVHFEMSDFFANALIMLPFGIGVLVGIIVVTKIIAKVLKVWPNASTWGILGLIVASPFAIILKVGVVTIGPLTIIGSLACFALGFALAYKLGEK
jgi:putative membrane protein